jgi:CRISPR-associated protein (TIGR02584 family)
MDRAASLYPRSILLAVTGLTPQVVTETLCAMVQAGEALPTEIHVMTTAKGRDQVRQQLLGAEGWLTQLYRDYRLPPVRFDESNLHVIADATGLPLDDIRSPEDNDYAADGITGLISRLTADPASQLHVSLAGGRKTMGFFAGYALSLFGRAQDRLSHVLVSAPYEAAPGFFYPTPYPHRIKTHAGQEINAQDAQITLADIPFIRLREDIPARLLSGKAGFSETIDAARRASEPPFLMIDLTSCQLHANGLPVSLPDILFAFYCWVAEHSLVNEQPLPKPSKGSDGNLEYAAEFLRHYRAIAGEMRDTEKTENALRKGMDEGFFEEKVSRINRALKEELGERLGKRYGIVNQGHRGHSDYGLALSAEQIQIV